MAPKLSLLLTSGTQIADISDWSTDVASGLVPAMTPTPFWTDFLRTVPLIATSRAEQGPLAFQVTAGLSPLRVCSRMQRMSNSMHREMATAAALTSSSGL